MKKKKFNWIDVMAARYLDENVEQPDSFGSLDELVTFINQYDTTGCLFRGQAGLWPIVSTIFRHYGTDQFERAQTMTSAAVRFLKDNRYIQNAIQDNTNRALAIAQHYGCPTDLVDVTTNIDVAAYFASSENQNHEQNPIGCIWIFTPEDITQLQDFLRNNQEKVFVNASGEIIDNLRQNDWSLLYEIHIPELSRLNAQCGAFLWDLGGSLDHLLNWCIPVGRRFEFNHTENERDAFVELEKRLFPYPNQLESEIMRIFKENSREKGLPSYSGLITKVINEKEGVTKNGLSLDIVDAFGSEPVVLPLPDFFRPDFPPYQWEKRQLNDPSFKEKRINMEKCLHCYLQDDPDGIQQVVDHILEDYRKECLTDYLIAVFYLSQKAILSVPDAIPIIDMVVNLSNYGYTNFEIARVLQEYFRLEFFKRKEDFTPASDEERLLAIIAGKVEALTAQYYGCKVTKLYISDGQEHMPFWLPESYEFLDAPYLDAFSQFDKTKRPVSALFEDTFAELPDNVQIFLYQHQLPYIMPYQNMKEIFIRFYLPQLYAFRTGAERILIPDYLTSITLPYFGRVLYIKEGEQ